MTNHSLINDLHKNVENIISIVEKEFKSLSINELTKKTNVDKWNTLECLEHLNRYAAYYIPAIKKALQTAQYDSAPKVYKNGWFGKMSIEMMSPQNTKKQQAIAKFNPKNSPLDLTVITQFLTYQEELLTLLKVAKSKNISQRKVPVEFFRLMKMKIGDALTFLIIHQQRHILQAQGMVKNLAKIR